MGNLPVSVLFLFIFIVHFTEGTRKCYIMGTPVKYEILSIPLLVLQVFPFSFTSYLILQTKVSCICDAGKLGVKQASLYVQRITQIQFLKKKKKVPISSAFVQFLKRPRYVHGFTFIHFYKKKQAFPYVEEIHAQDQLKKVPVTMCMAVLGFVIEQRRSQYYMVRYHCKCLANKRFHGQKV